MSPLWQESEQGDGGQTCEDEAQGNNAVSRPDQISTGKRNGWSSQSFAWWTVGLVFLLLQSFKTVCGKYTRLCLQLLLRIYFYSRALDLAQPTRNPLFSDGNLNWKISAGSQHHNLWNICGGGCSQNCFRCCLKKHKGSRGEMIWGAVRSSCPD